MPLADIFIIIPHERAWVRGIRTGSAEHIQQLRQQMSDAVEREQSLQGMMTDIHIDLQNAIRDRRTAQRELWEMQR